MVNCTVQLCRISIPFLLAYVTSWKVAFINLVLGSFHHFANQNIFSTHVGACTSDMMSTQKKYGRACFHWTQAAPKEILTFHCLHVFIRLMWCDNKNIANTQIQWQSHFFFFYIYLNLVNYNNSSIFFLDTFYILHDI